MLDGHNQSQLYIKKSINFKGVIPLFFISLTFNVIFSCVLSFSSGKLLESVVMALEVGTSLGALGIHVMF